MRRELFIVAMTSGCVAMSPPPLLSRHAGPAPLPEGTVSVTFATGFAASGFLDFGFGGEVRVASQISPDVEVGIGIGLGVADIGVAPARIDPMARSDASVPTRDVGMLAE